MGPVGAAPLLRRAVALHVHDVKTVHVKPLALNNEQHRRGAETRAADQHQEGEQRSGLKAVVGVGVHGTLHRLLGVD